MNVTIKAFAEKYKITYCQAYELSYGVEPVSTMVRDKDFPEEELFENLVAFYDKQQFEGERAVVRAKKRLAEINRIRKETLHPIAP